MVGQSFAERKQPSDPLFQTAYAPARGRVIKDVNVSESLAERNSLVFFGAELPMLQQVIKNVNDDHNFSGTDKFFNHSTLGWFVG